VRVLVSGATGFIGTELVAQLASGGHETRRLARVVDGHVDAASIEWADAVVNLSGAPTSRLPWTRRYVGLMLSSRLDTTNAIARAINAASSKPAVLVNAAGIAYYGDRPGEELTEQSTKGDGLLSDLVAAWETAAHGAATRVVTLRTGLVTGHGGAFTPLAPLTRLGLGARYGSGRQYWPWISVHDTAAAIVHLLASGVSGPVNIVGPTPATAAEVTRTLARAMLRPHVFAIPAWLVRLVLGTGGTELLLLDQRAVPGKLLADGFRFEHETIESAIRAAWPARA
jgi:uncharacterized protein (TIGR01777 family)